MRRDIINAVKRSATASRKANERAERARLKGARSAPQQAHYPQAQAYGHPAGQAYSPAPPGYAAHGYGPAPNPTWTAPPQKNGHSPAVILVAVIGSLFFCGTCSAVLVSTSGTGTRESSPAPPVRRAVAAPAAARPTSTARSTPAPPRLSALHQRLRRPPARDAATDRPRDAPAADVAHAMAASAAGEGRAEKAWQMQAQAAGAEHERESNRNADGVAPRG